MLRVCSGTLGQEDDVRLSLRRHMGRLHPKTIMSHIANMTVSTQKVSKHPALAMFDQSALPLIQEDSQKSKKGVHMTGLYFFPFMTCRMGPKASALETASDPEARLFNRLEGLQARDHVHLRPGRILVAVYGDNW